MLENNKCWGGQRYLDILLDVQQQQARKLEENKSQGKEEAPL